MPTWFEKFKRAALTVEAGPFTAVDFDRDQARFVYAEHRGLRTRVIRMESLAIPATLDVADPQALGELLGGAIRSSPHRGAGMVMSVPRSRVVLQPLRLPLGVPENEMAAMVRIQVEKELAFAPDEAVIDFALISHYDSPEPTAEAPAQGLDVLAVAVKRPEVEYYRKLAEAARFKLLRLTLRPYASACALGSTGEAAQTPSCRALVHITADEAEITVVTGPAVALTRTAPLKMPRPDGPGPKPAANTGTPGHPGESPDLAAKPAPVADSRAHPAAGTPGAPGGPGGTAPAAAASSEATPPPPPRTPAEELVTDATRTLRSFMAMQRQRPMTRLIIAGGTGLEGQVVKGLTERMGVQAELFDPQAALGVRNSTQEVPAYIAALGLALGFGRPDRLPFDFLNPKRTVVRRDPRKVRRIAMASGAGAAVVLVVLLGMISLWNKAARVASLKRSLAQLKTQNEKVRVLQRRDQGIRNWLNGTPNWLDQWAELSGLFPDARAVYITGLRTSPDGTISFTVKARNDADITDLGHRLEEAGYAFRPGQLSEHEDALGYSHTADVKLAVTGKVRINLASLQAPPRPGDDGSGDPAASKAEVHNVDAPAGNPAPPNPTTRPAHRGRGTRHNP